MPKTLAALPEEMLGFVDKFFCSYYLSAPPEGAWPSGDYFGDAGVCVCVHNLYPLYAELGLVWSACRAQPASLDLSPTFGATSKQSIGVRRRWR